MSVCLLKLSTKESLIPFISMTDANMVFVVEFIDTVINNVLALICFKKGFVEYRLCYYVILKVKCFSNLAKSW